MEKIRQYILPSPDSAEHRRVVSKGDGHDRWTINEYSGFRVLVRCQPVSKADVLNGVQYGEIEFLYEVSRHTQLPALTSAGLQWQEWSKWVDQPKPLTKAQEAEAFAESPEYASLMLPMYRMALAADSRDRHFPFRKLADEFQLEWEYNESSTHPTLMLAAEVKRYFATAETEAARLRVAEAEEIRRVQEEAATQAKAEQEGAKYAMERARMSARMMRPANPEDYYPPGSVRREEEGSPTVLACVGLTGALLREPVVTDTSGFPELDAAAIKVAKATRYAAAVDTRGKAIPESCIRFKVRFKVRND